MRVSDLGEFGLIDALCRRVPTTSRDLVVPPGDDAAVWLGGTALATTDTLVEDVHFRLRDVTPAELGWKALAVNLSDVAAMGGVPRWALVTLGLRPDTPAELLAGLYDGLADACRAFGVVVAGGDVVSTRGPIFVTVALVGDAPGGADSVLRRDRARPGDVIAVTGTLGGASAWLKVTDRGGEVPDRLRRAHFRPTPRVEAGRELARVGVRCAMDVSDGLVQDLGHICRASGVSARVDVERVPVEPAARAGLGDADAVACALYGGEDYELLCCGPRPLVDLATTALAGIGVPLTTIGQIDELAAGEGPGVRLFERGQRVARPTAAGWDHLRETHG